MFPTLTVVTPSLNHGAFIGAAIDSARPTGDYRFEHIVVDAASTDDTHAALAARPHLTVLVRPELDSHEALNFALTMAHGDVIGFLNADDRYEPGILDAVMAHFAANPETMLLCGGMRVFIGLDGRENDDEMFQHLEGADMRLELTFGNPGFNSWFFRRSLLLDLEGFRTRYRFAADRDLLLRAYARAKPVPLRQLAYHYRKHEGSRTMDPRGTNRHAMIMDHLAIIATQLTELWTEDPAMRRLLIEWDALERLKLFVRAMRYDQRRAPGALLCVPWPLVPVALYRRSRWLRILRNGGHTAALAEGSR